MKQPPRSIAPPISLTILAQALLTVLFGFLGLMVAVPLVATAMVMFRMLYMEPDPAPSTSAVPPIPGLAASG